MRYDTIPTELTELPQWVCAWKNSKIPMQAKIKKGASSVSPDTWSTYKEAKAAVEQGAYDYLGFVFQFYNLMPNLTAMENVSLAQSVARDGMDAAQALDLVGLSHRLNNFPAELSGGEQQRVAIARAVVKNPLLLLCDEPTGALDSATGKSVLALLKRLCEENGETVVVVTHNANLRLLADRLIRVQDGCIVENTLQTPVSVEEITW